MTEQGNEVPIFNDAANGITQFIVPPPSIDGVEGVHTVQGATDLQESSLLDLSLGNTSAQFIQILGENGEIQYIQLLPEQHENVTFGNSSIPIDLGHASSANEMQLVQAADGAITYLTSETGIPNGLSNEPLQTITLDSDNHTSQVLSGNEVQSFVNDLQGQTPADQVNETIKVSHTESGSYTNIIGSTNSSIGTESDSQPSTDSPNKYLVSTESNNSVLVEPDANNPEIIYLQKDTSAPSSVEPATLNGTLGASFVASCGNIKVIKIPPTLPANDTPETVRPEKIAPIKVIHLPSKDSGKTLPGKVISVNPFSATSSIIDSTKPSQNTDNISAKVVLQKRLNDSVNDAISKGGKSFVSSTVNSAYTGNVVVHVSTDNQNVKPEEIISQEITGVQQTTGNNQNILSQDEGKGSTVTGKEIDSTQEENTSEKKKDVLDLNQPIELTSHTVVTVNGKKCLLRVDPASKQLVAYPVKPDAPKRPRGRPKKQKTDVTVPEKSTENVGEMEEPKNSETAQPDEDQLAETEDGTNVQTERESHALEGLLGLSDIDGRRKSLRSKKKPKTLVDEYETGTIDGVDDDDSAFVDNPRDKDVSIPLKAVKTEGGAISNEGPLVIRGVTTEGRRGRGRPKTKDGSTAIPTAKQTRNQLQNYLANLGLPVKRGRGRPRRSLPEGVKKPVCAYVINSKAGQTVVMAATPVNKTETGNTLLTPKVLPTAQPVIRDSTISRNIPSSTASSVTLASSALTTDGTAELNIATTTEMTMVNPTTSNQNVFVSSPVTPKEDQTCQVQKPKITLITNPLMKQRLSSELTTTVNLQATTTSTSLKSEVKSIQPTVIPVIRSLASGNITMTTTALSQKPAPLQPDHIASDILNNRSVNITSHKTANPLFTVAPEKGKMPIILRSVDSKSGQVTLKKVGGLDNKLSQDIMNGQRMDVIEKGITADTSSPQVKTALDGTLTVLYQNENLTSDEIQHCEVKREIQASSEETHLDLKNEETAEELEETPTETVSVGVCEVPEVRESVEDSPANPETEEDEEVDVVTDVHSELSTEDKLTESEKMEEITSQECAAEQNVQKICDDLNTDSEHNQDSPSLRWTILESLQDPNLVVLDPSSHESSDEKKSFMVQPASSDTDETGLAGVNEDADTPEPASPEKEESCAQKEGLVVPTSMIQLHEEVLPVIVNKTSVQAPLHQIGLRSTEEELQQLKCSKCGFQAYYEKQYREHIAAHTDVPLHRCKCCKFVSFTKEELVGHFKKVHPKLLCTVCNFMAEHRYTIKRHMQRHDPVGITCEMCGKKYKDQYILKIHIKMVHMPAEVLFECEVCQKKFTRKAHLKRHMRTHDPEKPFKCPHCDYRGCERSDITKHVVIHDEPKFWCEVCGKNFRHIKNKELHLKRHRGQRDYKCGVCDFYGYTFTDIRKHIERKHAEHRNIMCQNCGCKFRNETILKDHSKYCCEMLLVEPGVLIPKSGMNLADPSSQVMEDSELNATCQGLNGAEHYMGEDEGTVMEEQVTLSDEVSVNFGDQCMDGQEQLDIGEDHMIDTSLNDMAAHPVSSGDFVTVTQDQGMDSQGLEGQVISIGGLEVGQRITGHHHKMVLGDTGYSMESADVYGATSDDLTTDMTVAEEGIAITM